MKTLALAVVFASGIAIGATGIAWAAKTNYLGPLFIADPTTVTQQLKVNADGSINVVCQ